MTRQVGRIDQQRNHFFFCSSFAQNQTKYVKTKDRSHLLILMLIMTKHNLRLPHPSYNMFHSRTAGFLAHFLFFCSSLLYIFPLCY